MSDSWKDGSGIDGNYDNSEMNKPNKLNNTHESSESSKNPPTNDIGSIDNIREAWNGRTCYVSDELASELDTTFLEMKTELLTAADRDIKKNRHFYPVVLQLGIEEVRDADAEELESFIEDIN